MHPFFSDLHDPSDEPICERPFFIEHEIDNLPVKILKRKILRNSCMTSFEKKSYHSSEENLFKDFDETFVTNNNTETCKSTRNNLRTRQFNSHGDDTESSTTNSSVEPPTSSCNQLTQKCVSIFSEHDTNNFDIFPSLKDAMNHEVLIDEPFRDPGVCERKYHENEAPVKSSMYAENSETSYFSGLSPVIDVNEPLYTKHNEKIHTNNNTYSKGPFLEIRGRSCADKIKTSKKYVTQVDRCNEKSIECMNNEILRSLNDRKSAHDCSLEVLLSNKFAKQSSARPMAHWGDSLKFWI